MSDPAAPEGAREIHLPPSGKKWSRTVHLTEKGGCGADISAACYAFSLNLPAGIDARGRPVMLQQIVRVTPLICPTSVGGCGRPLFFEDDAAPSRVEVASAIPRVPIART